MQNQAFYPNGNTANITASAASSNVQVFTGGYITSGSVIRVYNSTTVTVFIAFGATSAVTASTSTGLPIPAGDVEIITVPANTTYVAGITASGGGTVYFTPGEGM